MASFKKFIAFDLDTKALQENYPNPKSWRNAYFDIRNFMEKNNFIHQQGSAYISKNLLQDKDVVKLSQNLIKQYLWLDGCIEHINLTNISEISFDLQPIINATAKQLKKQQKANVRKNSRKTPKPKLVPKAKDPKNKTNTLSR